MTKPLRLGIVGLGTVGIGLVKNIQQKTDILSIRAGRIIEIKAVSARSKTKNRGIDLSAYEWESDAISLAKRDDIDVFVELMGGDGGIALEAVKIALETGKHVVTANKAMLALHGNELAHLAESNGVNLRFEAAVAGGIPVVKVLTESLAGNEFNRIMGVMNGTCNYILTRMEKTRLSYDQIFAEAKDLGYLEADPNLDVGGIDAAHKLVLLTTIAFGVEVNFAKVTLEGIQHITIDDIRAAGDMGYRIKLLGISEKTEQGLSQVMRPCLVSMSSPLAHLEGGTNMIIIDGDGAGQIVLGGAGAGEAPTASAVAGDIMDIARGLNISVFGQPAHGLPALPVVHSMIKRAFYIRLNLHDQADALDKVTAVLAPTNISIDRIRQDEHATISTPVIIVTHPVDRNTIDQALSALSGVDVLIEPPVVLAIEEC